MQYQVLLDPAKVAGAGLSVPADRRRARRQQRNAGGGFYSQGGQFYYVRGLGRSDAGGHRQRRRRGAQRHSGPRQGRRPVVIGHAPRLGQFGFNEPDDAVEGVILMRTASRPRWC
jgi:cobalt-zinc-cadmium resistance protein CzcA